MYKKNLIISISIIVVLSGYIFVRNMKTSKNLPELLPWDDTVNIIEIKKNNNFIKIVNKNNKWLINDEEYPADSSMVDDIIEKIKNLKIIDIVSKKGFYNKYELTPEKGISIIVRKDSKKVRQLLIGKKSSTNRHTFVKIGNKPEIFLVAGTFDGNFKKSSEELREMDIFSVKSDSITGFEIKYKNKTFNFNKSLEEKKISKNKKEKENDKIGITDKKNVEKVVKWRCKGYGFVKISTQKINSLFSGLNPLKASSYLTKEKNILTNPLCSIKIIAEAKEIRLNIFQKDKGKSKKYASTSSESPYVFTLDEWSVEKFFIDNIESLKGK